MYVCPDQEFVMKLMATYLHGKTDSVAGMAEDVNRYKRLSNFEQRAMVNKSSCQVCLKDKPYCGQCGGIFWSDTIPSYTGEACNQWTGFLLAFDLVELKLGTDAKPADWLTELHMLCPDSKSLITVQ